MDQGETTAQQPVDAGTREAQLALWAIPGIGPKAVERLTEFAGSLGALLEVPMTEWAGLVALAPKVKARLFELGRLSAVSAVVRERAERAAIGIAFPGDPAYPARIAETPGHPAVLFYRGEPRGPRRRVALVGSRRPGLRFVEFATSWASRLAARGVGIVSGAAVGIDQAGHKGALAVRGETWAFLGSALDEIDPAQKTIAREIVDGGGMVFSELPPGVRASVETFPRRNRLISGASDVVLVMRAKAGSGALHTVRYAEEQLRPVFAMPGDVADERAAGSNQLLFEGRARFCLEPADLFGEPRVGGREAGAPLPEALVDLSELSEQARAAYPLLRRSPQSFEELLTAAGTWDAATLVSALCELELFGLALQRPGKVYEKV